MLLPVMAMADTLSLTNLVAGELLTTATHTALYLGYRQGDPGVTNNWYRWVVKAETSGPGSGNIDFKWMVPDDFAYQWNNGRGIVVRNVSGQDISSGWEASASNTDLPGDMTRLFRAYSGPFIPWQVHQSKWLHPGNPLTIEYLARVGSESTTLQTNGWQLSSGGSGFPGWEGYITNSIPTPTKFVPPAPEGPTFGITTSISYGNYDLDMFHVGDEVLIQYSVRNTTPGSDPDDELTRWTVPIESSTDVLWATVPGGWNSSISSNSVRFAANNSGSFIAPGQTLGECEIVSPNTNLVRKLATAMSNGNGPFVPFETDVPGPSPVTYTLTVNSFHGTALPGTVSNVLSGTTVQQSISPPMVLSTNAGERFRLIGPQVIGASYSTE